MSVEDRTWSWNYWMDIRPGLRSPRKVCLLIMCSSKVNLLSIALFPSVWTTNLAQLPCVICIKNNWNTITIIIMVIIIMMMMMRMLMTTARSLDPYLSIVPLVFPFSNISTAVSNKVVHWKQKSVKYQQITCGWPFPFVKRAAFI